MFCALLTGKKARGVTTNAMNAEGSRRIKGGMKDKRVIRTTGPVSGARAPTSTIALTPTAHALHAYTEKKL